MEISRNLLYFDIRQDKFAISMGSVIEVVTAGPYEKSYFPIPILRGKGWYRGKEIFIIDLTDLFGLELPSGEISASNQGNILILEIQGQLMGLRVDRIGGVAVPKKLYPYPKMASTLEDRYFEGIAKIHDDLVIVLNEKNLIDDNELEVLKA
ncbi:MAG TPA: chemotaxis protein CheW [Candidatus Limnocylindrales bacterium]|nr:chemotaxis protein CheW [Candidatus Limnocylindrales bacterium]